LTTIDRTESRLVLPLVSGQQLNQPMPLEAGPISKGLRLPIMRRS
jgi:hypothetical protein